MVALNYARDVRIGDKPARAVALGSNFVWPALPERLFLRGQSMVYDFVGQKYATRLPDNTIDYTTNVNDLGIVTRASTSTYWGPEGSLLEAAVDEARIQHDPVTGEPLGVLIESSATNVETTGRALDSNEYWNTAVVPDDKFGQAFHLTSPNDNMGFRGNYSSFNTGGGEYGQLRVVYVKRVNCRYVAYWASARSSGIVFDLDEGVFLYGDSAVSEYLGDGWWKLHLYGAWGNAVHNQFRFSYGSTFTDSIITICERQEGDQILIGSLEIYDTLQETPPTPLQTQDSAVTRAADNAVIDLSDVLNPDEGTYVVRAVVKDDGEDEYYAGWYDGSLVTPRLSIKRLADGDFSFRAGNRYISIPPPDHLRSGDVVTLAIAYNEGQITAAGFGEASTSSSDYYPAGTVRLVRGTGTSSSDNSRSLESYGIIAGFEYYPVALSESQMAGITTFTPGDNS